MRIKSATETSILSAAICVGVVGGLEGVGVGALEGVDEGEGEDEGSETGGPTTPSPRHGTSIPVSPTSTHSTIGNDSRPS